MDYYYLLSLKYKFIKQKYDRKNCDSIFLIKYAYFILYFTFPFNAFLIYLKKG